MAAAPDPSSGEPSRSAGSVSASRVEPVRSNRLARPKHDRLAPVLSLVGPFPPVEFAVDHDARALSEALGAQVCLRAVDLDGEVVRRQSTSCQESRCRLKRHEPLPITPVTLLRRLTRQRSPGDSSPAASGF